MDTIDIERARFNMIEQQIRPWEVLDQDVLDLLFRVKREDFVPPRYRKLAFADMQIPIGAGEVMLTPKAEARMLQALADYRIAGVISNVGFLSRLVACPAFANADLEPVPSERRTWTMWNFAALWISMAACIPTYMLASSLIGGGMNWSQAIVTIFLGNLVVVAAACGKKGPPLPPLRDPPPP